jgi:hypothetical protein
MDLRDHVRSTPFNTTFSLVYGGQTVVARVDPHSWTFRDGQLVTGLCIKGITLYAPVAATGVGAVVDSLDTPDPTAAVFDEAPINWGLVAVSAGATVLIIGAFVAALHFAAPNRHKLAS